MAAGKTRLIAALGAAMLLFGTPNPAAAAPPLDLNAETFAPLRAFIHPRPEETKWQEIKWFATLVQAREEAARVNKPIFMWSMDGHPLGCT